MYLTIATWGEPYSEDLSFLLHKHPDRVHQKKLSVGRASVFTPVLMPERCEVALLLEIDPIGLVRGRGAARESFTLGQYVNERPYAASSLLMVAMRQMLSTALSGRCDARPATAAAAFPLEIHIPSLPSTGGVDLVRELFEPLGWSVAAETLPLEEIMPEWGDSRLLDATLRSERLTLAEALNQLFILLPVLDDAKHYWVDSTEVQKLLRIASSWLTDHPHGDLISRRYLAHQREYIAALSEEPSQSSPKKPSLAGERRDAVIRILHELNARSVLDMGCGPGALLGPLVRDPAFSRVVGADVSASALARAERNLNLETMPDRQREKLTLLHSALTYRDDRLTGFDAMVLMEVIEHLDLERLPSLERSVFEHARPKHVVVTTPNSEYNVLYEGLMPGAFRHPDHRFEWTREQFRSWAEDIGRSWGYRVSYRDIGPADPDLGSPTQAAIFSLEVSA